VRIFHKEAKSLAKAGYDVTLIAQHIKDEVVDGVKIIAIPKSFKRFSRVLITDIRILISAFKQKADIYHFHDPELIPVGVLLKLSGKKVIYDVHEDLPEQIMGKHYIPFWMRRPIAILVQLIEQLASTVFNYIFVATDSIEKNFDRHQSAITIRNFPILNSSKTHTVNGNRKTHNYVLIYTGGLTEERGITNVINSLEYIDCDLELILLGEFETKVYGDKVRSLKGFNKVRYFGKLDFIEIGKYYNQADIGVVCLQPIDRYKISLPTKLFEYMEAGLPVVASNFPLWIRIIDESSCGICVDPTNPEEISDAIKYLIEHPDKAKEMGENGRRAVLERYNWDKESKKLLAAYKVLSS
jgi:glycosyltransferase involved in cell wall biosynthesis